MEDQDEIMMSPHFQEGFNNGYLLSEYMPDFMEKFALTNSPTNEFMQGFEAGRRQLEYEESQRQLQELGRIRERSAGRDLDYSLDFPEFC